MKNTLRFILNILPALLIVVGVSFLARQFAEAKYKASPATAQMSKDIRDAQEFVKEYGPKVQAAMDKANIYRETICRTEKDACTKEYLDPLGSAVDLSAFLAPAAK